MLFLKRSTNLRTNIAAEANQADREMFRVMATGLEIVKLLGRTAITLTNIDIG
jgi:predicted RNA-binding protein YlxR (DUF448 family)